MLLYAMLYLTGYDLSLDDIKQFRQWGSKTPGHPEYGLTAGVETTTGPLGQGCRELRRLGHGAALAGRASSTSGHDLFDYRIYAFCGDGDLMEGDQQRSGFGRRASRLVEPDLVLRQQSHHHRGQHIAGVSAMTWPRASAAGIGMC